MLSSGMGGPSTTDQVYDYWASEYPVSEHAWYVGGKPLMYDELPQYTCLAVINLKTGKMIGRQDEYQDADVDEALGWVDECNK